MPRQMPMMMRAGSAVSSVESQLMRPIQKNQGEEPFGERHPEHVFG